MSRRSQTISGQFAPRLVEMLESASHRVLSRAARALIERIEVEFAHHGGKAKENQRGLPVTFSDFAAFGIDRQSIAPAIREACALGFIVVTERGRAGNAEWRSPSRYRLTFRQATGIPGDGSHEWRSIANDPNATDAENLAAAAKIAKEARADKSELAVEKSVDAHNRKKATDGHRSRSPRKQNPGVEKSHVSGWENHPENGQSLGWKNHPTDQGWETHPTIDISGRVRGADPVPPPPPPAPPPRRRKSSRHRRPTITIVKAGAVPS